MRVWYLLACDSDAFPWEATRAALGADGVELYPCPDTPEGDSGIVVFNTATPQLCERLRTLSANGLQRVMAVAAPACTVGAADTWRLLQAGAADVVVWNGRTGPAQLTARLRQWQNIADLSESPAVRDVMAGSSVPWRLVLRRLVTVALGCAPVLVLGETGTGKELVAQCVHSLDRRPGKGALHVLDCTTIVPELAGSELFGHERGAFTHAVSARDGSFALANGGTLFLDEIGELPPPLQAQLLRVLQEGVYKRVGGNTWHRSEFRLICATHRDLRRMIEAGAFRQDLYYRIASATIRLPPLRERMEDVLPLVSHFLRHLRPGEPPCDLDPVVRDFFIDRDYPGNVRELRQLLARILDRHTGPGPITVGDLPEEERPFADSPAIDWRDELFDRVIRRALHLGVPLKAIGRAVEERVVEIAVTEEEGNLQRAARRLGVTDRALQLRRAMARSTGHSDSSMVG